MKKKTRSAAWFLREVRKSIKADPSKPVRFDVAEIEMPAVNAAYRKLVFDGGELVPWMMGKTESPPPPPRHIREGEQPKAGAAYRKPSYFARVAFIGPNVFSPVKIIRGTPARRYKGPQEAMEAWGARLDKLRGEYAPEHHVEGRPVLTKRPRDDRMDFEVWRGEDWLARRYATLYPAEIARLLEAGEGARYAVRMMEPHYKRRMQIKRQNKVNASKDTGGRGYIRYDELLGLLKKHKAAGLDYSEAEKAIAREKLPRNYSHYKIRDRIERREKVKRAADFYATL